MEAASAVLVNVYSAVIRSLLPPESVSTIGVSVPPEQPETAYVDCDGSAITSVGRIAEATPNPNKTQYTPLAAMNDNCFFICLLLVVFVVYNLALPFAHYCTPDAAAVQFP